MCVCVCVCVLKTRNLEIVFIFILNKITGIYKIDNNNTIKHIDNDIARLANKLKIRYKLGKINSKNIYILIKDHRRNFINKNKARLINPTKTELV